MWTLEHLGQEEAEKFLATLDSPIGSTSRAVPDDQFDDSFNQIKQQ